MVRPKRVSRRKQAYNKRKAGRSPKFGRVYWDEPEEEVKGLTISTPRLRRERKREEVRRAKPKEKALIMAQPLSARGEFAKKTEIRVPSTVIFWVEYYPEHERMIIAFRVSGKYYTYFKVPLSVFQAFKLAPSKGRYFNKYIKGKYSFEKGANRP